MQEMEARLKAEQEQARQSLLEKLTKADESYCDNASVVDQDML